MDDPTECARATMEDLVAFEREVLVDLATGSPRHWGAAVGQAYEVLIARRCMTETFAVTDLGHEVTRLITQRGADR